MKSSHTRIVALFLFFILLWTPLLYANDTIDLINQAIQNQGANWKAGENWVTRLPEEEQRALCGAILVPEDVSIAPQVQFEQLDLPEFYDWRDNGGNWITPVTDQGNCGSCWDFGAVAQVETWWKINNANLDSMIDLSEQFVLSCSGAGGCDGGAHYLALDFIKNVGVPSEACLPYEADDSVPCGSACANWQNEAVTIPGWGWVTLADANVEAIKQAVYRMPVSTGFTVYQDFYSYSGGVYEYVWGALEGGHVVLIVGWDDAEQCWICKNSWGPAWGENGYFRIHWGECQFGQFSNCIWSETIEKNDYTISLQSNELTLTTGDSIEFPLTIRNNGAITLDCAITEMGHQLLFHADEFMAYDGMSFWCGHPELGGYSDWFMEHLDTPLMDLSGTTSPKLTFMTRWAIEEPYAWGAFDGWDGSNVWISVDGGKNYTTITPTFPPYTCTSLYGYDREGMMFWGFDDPVPGWAGFSSGWVPAEFDLSGFQSDSVVIRFSFAADMGWSTINQSNLTGFAIDDIQIADDGQILYKNTGDSLDGMYITGFGNSMQTDWLSLEQNNASVESGDSIEIPVCVRTHALEPNRYSGILGLSVNDSTGLMNSVPFTLIVEPAEHDLAVKTILYPGEFIPILCPVRPKVQIKNIGQNIETGFGLVLQLKTGSTQVYSNTVSDLTLNPMQSMIVSFNPLRLNDPVDYNLEIFPTALSEDNNSLNDHLENQLIVSNLVDDFEGEPVNWSIVGDWQIEDAPAGNGSSHSAFISGSSDSDAVLTFIPKFDLSPVERARLQYWIKTSLRADEQTCYFEISTDSLSWTRMDSVTGVTQWHLREIDLTPCIRAEQYHVWFRFYYATSGPSSRYGVQIDDVEIYPESPSVIEPDRIDSPYEWKLSRNYPNPFNPETRIEYSMAKEGDVCISVYDLLGRRIRTLVETHQTPGNYRTVWNGQTTSGLEASSGVYLIRLETKEKVLSQKVLLLK